MIIGKYNVLFTAGDGVLTKDVWDYYAMKKSGMWEHEFASMEKPQDWDLHHWEALKRIADDNGVKIPK